MKKTRKTMRRKMMNKVLSLLAELEQLSITSPQALGQPLTIAQLQRIDSFTSVDELNDQDFELVNNNLTAAKAYGHRVIELEGIVEIPDYVGLYEQAHVTVSENTIPALSNVIELFPPCKLLTPRTEQAMAASTGEEERQSGGKTYSVQTQANHDVTVTFEFRTNPMTSRVTTKLRLAVSQALPVDTSIAWLPPQIGDDVMVSPILQCELKSGNTEAVVTRIFEPEEWEALPQAPEFGEVGDTEE